MTNKYKYNNNMIADLSKKKYKNLSIWLRLTFSKFVRFKKCLKKEY